MTTQCHLLTPEYPPKIGGVADYTRQIAVGLAGRGDEVHVWTAAADGGRPDDPGVCVHDVLGRFRVGDLWAADREMDRFPRPRRVVVQYAPHGYRWKAMNVGFAAWVASRAARGDRVDVMFHEAFQGFGGRPRHYLMAAVQRLMAFVVLRSADRVWVSTPTWAEVLRPYASRQKAIRWLPIPSNVPSRPPDPDAVPDYTVGHFGTYGPQTVPLLGPVLVGILTALPDATVRLIGANGDRYLKEFSATHPMLAGRVSATGAIPLEAVREELHRCAVMVQPVVNGVTVRNATVLACLANGRPVVGTAGKHTEAEWSRRNAAWLVPESGVGRMSDVVAQLLTNSEERTRLSDACRKWYAETFDIQHAVEMIDRMAA